MNTDEFYQLLNETDLEVTFTKKTDGTTRVLHCTKNIPEDMLSPEQKTRAKPEGLLTVFDTDARQWRSLYVDSITEVKQLETSYGLLQE